MRAAQYRNGQHTGQLPISASGVTTRLTSGIATALASGLTTET
jgi:hypothetical protein